MNDNVILATFNHNSEITTKATVQWNKGQILKIEGIYNLPNVFEVEVSNDRERGAKRYLGENYEFVIPDEYFQSGKMIYIWIMKRVEPSDITSKYLVKIPMKTRQKPLDYDYTSEQRDIVAKAIVALQDAGQEITTKMNEVINREKKVERIEESFYNLTALAETLPAGSEATVDKEKVDTDENNYMIFRFGIPQGIQGERGDKGETGNQGETGNGIQNIVLNSDYTLTINFTDGTSTTTRSIRGKKGDAFVYSDFTPEQLALLKGDKGDEGHSPVITASKSGKTTTITVDNTIIATINDGENGQNGNDGNDGHSPVITASKTNGVTTIKVDDTTIATVNDGLNGNKGDKGDKGDTPIITASKINGVTSVSADGTVIATINDGDKGDKGDTPIITASKAEKTTTIYIDGVSIATINDGINGKDGNNGHSPVITASKVGTVTSILIDGTEVAQINDGQKGADGNKGADGTDGHTPTITATKSGKITTISVDNTVVATINDGTDGNDYTLTTQDKTDIANLVIQILPTAQGVSF